MSFLRKNSKNIRRNRPVTIIGELTGIENQCREALRPRRPRTTSLSLVIEEKSRESLICPGSNNDLTQICELCQHCDTINCGITHCNTPSIPKMPTGSPKPEVRNGIQKPKVRAERNSVFFDREFENLKEKTRLRIRRLKSHKSLDDVCRPRSISGYKSATSGCKGSQSFNSALKPAVIKRQVPVKVNRGDKRSF